MGVVARQSIKGALANYLGVAIGFVTTFFVVTRMLTQAEVGLTRMMVDFAMLFSSLAQLGTSFSVVRFFPYFKDGSRHHGVFGWSLVLAGVGFVLFTLIFFAFSRPLTAAYVEQAPLLADYLYLLPMLSLFILYMMVFETNASVLMRITVPKMVREVGVRVFNLVVYLLYGYDVVSLDAFVWMICGSYGAAMLLDAVYLLAINRFDFGIFKIDRGFVTRPMMRDIVRYSLFMTMSVLATNLPLFNSLFVGAKRGAAVAGVYAIASYIANVVEIPYRSLGSISRPVVAAAVKEGDWRGVNGVSREVSLHQLLVSMLIFWLIWINLDTVFMLMPNGEAYRGGVGVVLWLGMAKVVGCSLSVCVDVLNYSRYYAWGVVMIAAMTVATIVLNNVLIEAWGIDGAGCASLLAYGVYFVPMLLLLWHKEGFSPFSVGQLKVVALMVVLFACDWMWRAAVMPLMGGAGVVDSVVKTVVLGGAAAVAIYGWKISPTVNGMIDKHINKIRGRV